MVHELIPPGASVPALVGWSDRSHQLWAAYFILSVILNCVTTGMIALPIIRMRRRFRKLGMITPHQQSYTRVLAILIESSLPFTLIGTAAIIVTILSTLDPSLTFAAELANGFWVVAMSLAPQLIIYRVAMGDSWTRNPTTDAGLVSQIVFAADLDGGGTTRTECRESGLGHSAEASSHGGTGRGSAESV
ncbi:hypothetical protein FA15DRAFT_707580 [Coprinopsis marcescibilis]|uniref:Uncharacterized protein n=1 Tax=Coprinopsis marcescibilis TaxID=230819 RepID=A0A5C3KYN4_COPMA|nr:hypothetical protein FA15DRAFT_707580 [Coprinopsis marcescibilis]